MVEEDPISQRDAGLKPKKLRLLRGADLRESALLVLFRLAVATTPVERWAGIAESVGRFGIARHSSRFRRFADRVHATSGLGEDSVFRLWRAYAATMKRRRSSTIPSGVGTFRVVRAGLEKFARTFDDRSWSDPIEVVLN
jgi:hypothetical protein